MTVPTLLPMLRPFEDAVRFQLQRLPMTAVEYREIEDDSRRRALFISGLTRKSAIEEFHRLATDAIANGMTKSDFAAQLGEILDKQKGLILDPQRMALINQNNLAIATSSGRFNQMMQPDVVASRPFWQYPTGPHDGRTSRVCLELEGLIARYDDPIWEHVYPPNHHGERHLKVLTLTEDEATGSDKLYESPGDRAYPTIDGQEIFPDPGFDYRPSLTGTDGRAFAAAADALGAELEANTPATYQLGALADLNDLLPAPQIESDVPDFAQFQDALNWTRGDGLIVPDGIGDAVMITRESFDRLTDNDLQFARFIVPMLEEPHEMWIVERARGQASVFTRRYFGVFRGQSKTPIGGFLEVSPEGWLMDAQFGRTKSIEQFRAGWLAYRRKAN